MKCVICGKQTVVPSWKFCNGECTRKYRHYCNNKLSDIDDIIISAKAYGMGFVEIAEIMSLEKQVVKRVCRKHKSALRRKKRWYNKNVANSP